MKNKVINVINLKKSFGGAKALEDINFEVHEGEFFAVVGPDASGKTTLLRILSSILHFESGIVEVLGNKIPSEKTKQHIAYMPQKFGLYEELSLIQNLNLYADLRGLSNDEKEAKFEMLLKATSLEPFKERLAGNLSGGMKQKLTLCTTLLSDPKILLLDEVSIGVDPISRRELMQIVKNLASKNTSVIWTTSYLDEAEKADKILLINAGKQVYFGSPIEFTNNIEGRTYFIQNKSYEKREMLVHLLKQPEIIDGTIVGDRFRILTKTKADFSLPSQFSITKTNPVLEDAFLDALDINLNPTSKLADNFVLSNPESLRKEIVIEGANLTRKFGSFTATNNVNFQIKKGEVYGFLGPNGAGKSTTFKMLCGLLRPTSGKASVMGEDLVSSGSLARQKIGYMAQKFSLYGELSALQNFSFFAGAYGLSKAQKKAAVEEIIEAFSLQNFLKQNTSELPLGIKQRIALGAAILHKPAVLFLDEPTSGVDPITRREFWLHINALCMKGVTIMVTTHFMDEAEYCDRLAIIYKGTKLVEGSPEELKLCVQSEILPNPKLEDVFIEYIKRNNV